MKMLPYGMHPLRLLALMLMILPFPVLLVLGMLWLWQNHWMLWGMVATIVCTGLGYGLQQWLQRRDRKLLAEAVTEPNPEWPSNADTAWAQVQALAETCQPEDWPLEAGDWVLTLGQRTLETVAHCYHPQVDKPLLELTVPHTLLVVERASRDLRRDVAENIPFSNRLTLGDLFRMQRWKDKAEQVFDVYRAGRMIINPVDGLLGEAWRHLSTHSFVQARDELHRWFLRAYVRKVGYYAIDLYSGRLVLTDDTSSVEPLSTQSRADLRDQADAADVAQTETEPLRILVLGRSNAGKSSLINALFGRLTAVADILSDSTQMLRPFVLSREGFDRALVFDSPGCDSDLFDVQQLQTAAQHADLIVWVSPVNRPDRQTERECLDALRTFFSAQINRRTPPLLVAASHIDRLRPVGEWQPPYDLAQSQSSKAVNISAAVQAVSQDLDVPVNRVIPVCLLEGHIYNVEDTLWAAMIDEQPEAKRVRLLRCLDEKKKAENWMLLRRQMINTGRFLKDLPNALNKR